MLGKKSIIPKVLFIFCFLIGNILSACSWKDAGSDTNETLDLSSTENSSLTNPDIVLIGINSKNSPWAYMQNETLMGYEVDVLNEIEKIMGVKFVYIPAINNTILDGLIQKKWDIASSSLLNDGSYGQNISFTSAYFESGLGLMVKEDSQINGFEFMQDGKFGAASNSDALRWLNTRQEMYGEYEIIEYPSSELAIEDLVNLNLSGVIAETSTLFYYLARHSGVRITAQSEETTPMAFAYRKGDLIGDRFNSAMQLLAANGTLPAIQEKWFGTSLVEENPLNLVFQESFGYPENYVVPDVIRVGIHTHNLPWEMIDKGEMSGFEVEILDEAAMRMGVSLEYIPANTNTILSGLLANQWDLSASSIVITQERVAEFDFTGPFFDHSLAVLTLAGSSITGIEHLSGGRYGVLDGSEGETWLRNHIEQYGPYVIDEYADLETAFEDLENQVISGVVSDGYVLLSEAVNNRTVEVPLLFGDVSPVAFAVRKSDYLCDVLNETINDMKEDGTMLEIYQRWFGNTIAPDSSTTTVFVRAYIPQQ